MKVLLTGGTGFIGQGLAKVLLSSGIAVKVTGLVRQPELEALGAEWLAMPDLRGEVDWTPALQGVDAVVHLAALAHRIGIDQATEAEDYDRINHLATRSLALAIAATPSITRFMFMSSVAVHGIPDHFPVTSSSPCAPINAYGRSKLRAEAAIREVLAGQSVRWAILRPVLVYGPGNPGNMSRLEGLLKRGIPIPVEQQPNRKAFLFIGNLISVIQSFLSSKHPVSGNAWIVADEQVVSTEDLVRAMAAAMNLPGRVIRLPRWVLTATARTGDALRRLGLPFPWNSETQEKLLGDHWVDTDAIQRELEWKAPYSTTEGIRLTFLR